jgi:hypothetical protein
VRPHSTRSATTLAVVCATALVACGEAPPPAETDPSAEVTAPAPALPDTGRVYERALVFVGSAPDSVFVVPWLLGVRTGGPNTERRARGWLLRGEVWDPFLDDRWETPPLRAPWRPLPHGALRVQVGEGGGLEGISFVEDTRRLDLSLGPARAEWTGRRGETFRFLDGSLMLAERSLPGLVLDLNRAVEVEEGTPGGWMVLTSGDSLHAVVHSPLREAEDRPGAWRGWVRVDFRDVPTADLTVDWAAVRAFEAARRDVPVGWTLRAVDGTVEGRLEARSFHLVAGEDTGPLLPVDGFFDVEGTLLFEGAEYPVRGLLRHTQGD